MTRQCSSRDRLEYPGLRSQLWLGALCGWQAAGYRLFMQSPRAEDLALAGELVAQGKLRPLVDSVHALSEQGCRDAYARLRSRRARGKVVVEV